MVALDNSTAAALLETEASSINSRELSLENIEVTR